MSAPLRIFVVEDHPVMREGYAAVFARAPGLAICGEAVDAASALVGVRETKPDLVIVDLALPGASGLELIRQLRAFQPNLRVLVVSAHSEALFADRAFRAGAHGYVMKDRGLDVIVEAVWTVLGGERYGSPTLPDATADPENVRTDPVRTFSDRELEVFRHLGQGRGTSEIAAALFLSPKTIETYRANIKRKLGIRSAHELVQRATIWAESLGTES